MSKLHLIIVSLLLSFSIPVSADVIDIADVSFGGNTYRAFMDDTSSLVWLDLNNFWDGTTTYNSLVSLLQNSGYHLASLSELLVLQSSMPAIPANFATDVTIVGGNNVSRNLIWGIYEDGNPTDGVSYSWKFDSDTTWQFSDNEVDASAVFSNDNPSHKDLGAWIVADDAVQQFVPVPTLSFWGLIVLLGLISGFIVTTRRINPEDNRPEE